MGLFEAIKILHEGKHKSIDIQTNGKMFWYDPRKDEFYLEYNRSKCVVGEHKFIEWMLEKLKVI